MKSFRVYNGDVVIEKTIEMVEGKELLQQKIERVLGTNKGEWKYDKDEGIDFSIVLRKAPNKGQIRSEIEEALWKVDETMTLTNFSLEMDGRNATIRFEAENDSGEVVGGEYIYGS